MIDKKAEIKKKNKKEQVIKTSCLLVLPKTLLDCLMIILKLKNINIPIPRSKEAPKAILLMRRNKKEKPIKSMA